MLRLYEAKIANARNNNGSHLRSLSGLRSIAHLLQTAGSDGAVCRQIIFLGVFPQEPPDYWGNTAMSVVSTTFYAKKYPVRSILKLQSMCSHLDQSTGWYQKGSCSFLGIFG